MDRDVFLILIGAGISLASSIVTLILQFVLGQWGEKLRAKREVRQEKSREIRAALLDKTPPTQTKSLVNSLLRRIMELDLDDLDIPSFLRRIGLPREPENGRHLTHTEEFWGKYAPSIAIGVIVFAFWLAYILLDRVGG